MKRGRDGDAPAARPSFLSTIALATTAAARPNTAPSSANTTPASTPTLLSTIRSGMSSSSITTPTAGQVVDLSSVVSASTSSYPPYGNNVASTSPFDNTSLRLLLKNTNLAHLRDAAVVAWLRDATEWVPDASAPTDLRFLLLSALSTLPWWRYMTVQGGRISKNHAKTFAQLERLLMLLVALSPHTVRGVIEVTMRPFTCEPVSLSSREAQGLDAVVPVDMVCRVWNFIAARYPHMVPDVLLWQSVEPLMPKRRWPHVSQHIAFLKVLLHLALDATLEPGGGEVVAISSGPQKGQATRGTSPPAGGACDTNTTSTRGSTGGDQWDYPSSDTAHGGASSSLYDSEATTTSSSSLSMLSGSSALQPSSSSSQQQLLHQQRSVDASLSAVQTLLDASTAHNNRVMVHRGAVVQLALKHLLDMELTFAATGSNSASTATGSSRPWARTADPRVDASDRDALLVLQRCADFVVKRLSDDLEAQGAAGMCGNASWWRDLYTFHVHSLMLLDRPVVLHTVAPRLALLGTCGEAADLVHRAVSTVLKGLVNAWPPPIAAASAPRAKGAPPPRGHQQSMMAPQILPLERRVAAARHIAPLVLCVTASAARVVGGAGLNHSFASHQASGGGVDSLAVGVMRRLLKWLAGESQGAAGASSSTSQQLVEAVFAQVCHLSAELNIPLSDLSTDVIHSLKGSLRRDASVAEGSEVACAIDRGLVLPFLYDTVLPRVTTPTDKAAGASPTSPA